MSVSLACFAAAQAQAELRTFLRSLGPAGPELVRLIKNLEDAKQAVQDAALPLPPDQPVAFHGVNIPKRVRRTTYDPSGFTPAELGLAGVVKALDGDMLKLHVDDGRLDRGKVAAATRVALDKPSVRGLLVPDSKPFRELLA